MTPLFTLLVLAALALVLAAVIGGVLVWREDRFYGRLRWSRKPPLELQTRWGVPAENAFRDALRELRMALANQRPLDAEGWVAAARRRGWRLAQTAALSEVDKETGQAARTVAERRTDLENRCINVEGTGAVGTLDQLSRSADKARTALEKLAEHVQGMPDETLAEVTPRARHHMDWAVEEIRAVVRDHASDAGLRDRLTAQAAAPVTDADTAAWDDFESHLVRWGEHSVPHFLRRHPERPPLPAYATVEARRKAHEARDVPHTASGAASAVTDATTAPASLADSADRRRAQARALHEEMTLQVASYDLDFDLQLRYPQFHNRDIPEVRAMDRAARRAADEWDVVKDVPARRLASADIAAYRAAVEAFRDAVQAADARVRLIGDAGIGDDELRDLETARGLFAQISDPGNPPTLRDSYRARLVRILRRIDERPGSRVSFSPQALLALEAGED